MINFDLEPECPDAELRATLQWIAASELGIPTIYFKKSQENRIEKVPCTMSGWDNKTVLFFLSQLETHLIVHLILMNLECLISSSFNQKHFVKTSSHQLQ